MTSTYTDHDPIVWDVKDPDDREWRKDYFGTSHTAVLFDKHPFESAASYWLDKRDGASKPTTQPMIRGQFLEDAVAAWWMAEHDEYGWESAAPTTRGSIIAIPDRIAYNPLRLLSIKTTTMRDLDGPSDYWIYQAQGEMMVTGVPTCTIVWLDGRMELHDVTIDFDPLTGQEIWDKATEFMASIEIGVMPDWIYRSAADIIRQYSELSDPLEAGDQALHLARDYWSLKAEADRYAKAADELRNQLFQLAQDHEALTCDGDVVATMKFRAGSKRIDSKALAAKYPDIAKEFTVQGAPTRVLTIPKHIKETIA